FDNERLEVEDDVGHVFDHAGDGGEFVLHALNLHAGDRAAFEAGEQNPPQAVADRDAEAAFKRLGYELAIRRGRGLRLGRELAGEFQTSPTNTHESSPVTRWMNRHSAKIAKKPIHQIEFKMSPTCPAGWNDQIPFSFFRLGVLGALAVDSYFDKSSMMRAGCTGIETSSMPGSRSTLPSGLSPVTRLKNSG